MQRISNILLKILVFKELKFNTANTNCIKVELIFILFNIFNRENKNIKQKKKSYNNTTLSPNCNTLCLNTWKYNHISNKSEPHE